jgi:Phage tail repeat like/Chaperone of endosialidase
VPGHRRFADVVPPGTQFHYSIAGVTQPGEWECGLGSIDAQGRLVRTPMSSAAPGNALVNFSTGLKTVALTAGASWFAGIEARAFPAIGDITGLQTALDGKQAAGNYQPAGSYALDTHGHGIANVAGLQTALDAKQVAGSYAAAAHTHSIANVTGLQTALDAKQPISTGHSAATIAAATDTLVIRRGTGWLNLPLGALPIETAAGHVGIGTDTPGCRLEVRGAVTANGLTVASSTTANIVSTDVPAQNIGPVLGFSGRYATSNTALMSTFATIRGALAGTGDANNLGGQLIFSCGDGGSVQQERLRLEQLGTLRPGADNSQSLGSATHRWGTIFAGTGTINTSDARAKKHIGPIPDLWLDAWGDVGWSRYKFRSLERGGQRDSKARWHIGLIAQDVAAAFTARGVDAFTIGLICRDRIDGDNERPVDIWGLRYDECFALEAAWQRRELGRELGRMRRAIELLTP